MEYRNSKNKSEGGKERKRRGTKLCCSWDAKEMCVAARQSVEPVKSPAQATTGRATTLGAGRFICPPHGRSIIRKSGCRSSSSHELPSPTCSRLVDQSHFIHQGLEDSRTILNEFSSSLICCASMGVSRLHVAVSPRRSYSWLGQVS